MSSQTLASTTSFNATIFDVIGNKNSLQWELLIIYERKPKFSKGIIFYSISEVFLNQIEYRSTVYVDLC